MANAVAPFLLPHCPRTACRFHRSGPGWRWKHRGFFARDVAPHRVQRFRCGHCGHTFSEQTFRTSYWLKRPEALAATALRLGRTARLVPIRDLLKRRVFPDRVGLPPEWVRHYAARCRRGGTRANSGTR